MAPRSATVFLRDRFAGVLREFFINTPNSHPKDSRRSLFAQHVRRIKQSNQIRRRVVRCDTSGSVAAGWISDDINAGKWEGYTPLPQQ